MASPPVTPMPPPVEVLVAEPASCIASPVDPLFGYWVWQSEMTEARVAPSCLPTRALFSLTQASICFCRWLFSVLHPSWGIGLANYFSRKSRAATGGELEKFLGEENEWLAIYSKEILQKEHFDYFIYGHRHLPLDLKVGPDSRYINLGDWINYFTYAVFDGETTELKKYSC